jgi:uncharacterized protein (DUF433 family)
LRVDRSGRIYLETGSTLENTFREGVLGDTLNLLGPFETQEGTGPDLVRPREHLRIVPGKVSGEPHLDRSRITTQTIAALYDRVHSVERVASYFPEVSPDAIREAVELERQLAA